MRLRLLLATLLALATHALRAEDFQGSTHPLKFDEELPHYSAATPDDAVSRLQAQILAGEVKLGWDEQFGYLPGLLDALDVPRASQGLVFSKTSLQRQEISPSNPRALFFSDDIYIGYIPGAPVLEIIAQDPKLGAIFYTLDQEKVRKPRMVRDQDCLRCHGTSRSMGVPGPVLRSLATDLTGELETGTEAEAMNHCTPLAERWGGWYVTGQSGAQAHRGNLVGAKQWARHKAEPGWAGNVADLAGRFDLSRYPAPTSDITALMVLEHQAHMHNYFTRLNFESQQMLASYGHIRYLRNQVNAFLRYLLFTEEAALTEPVVGDPSFARDFAARGPRDAKGRSLRDLDLNTRMFRHPCSFLIYSPEWDALPEPMREHLWARLYDILAGKDADPQWARLGAGDRQAILDILRETRPGLPVYWEGTAGAAQPAVASVAPR